MKQHVCANPDTCWCWIPEFPSKLNNYEKALLVLEKGPHRQDEVAVDMQTANVLKMIYESLSEPNKQKFLRMDLIRLSHECWNIIGKISA